MNKKTYILIAVVSIIFAGCQNQPAQTPQVSNNTQQTPTQMQETVSLADQANYDAAMKLRDPSYCEKIELASLNEQCKTEYNDGIQLAKALIQKDQTFCEELSTEDKKQACKVRLEVMAKEAETQEMQKQTLEEDQKNVASLLQEKDYASCKNLKLESSRYDCEMNILSNEALQQKDPAWCDKASIPEAQKACHELYQTNQPPQP